MPTHSLATALAGIDTRSLAALRVGMAAVLLWDQAVAMSNACLFYSDAGLLPRVSYFKEGLDQGWLWSLHLINGSAAFQVVLLSLAMLAALALLLGWRTRLATAVSWVLLCSLHARNPAILYGGDTVLRLLLFWGLFLPLGARFSVDAAAHPQPAAPRVFTSVASFALLLQVACIYWFTAILKYGNEWTRDGTALYYVLSADQFVHGLGHWLLGQPELCRWLTLFVWWLEMLGPFAIFLPLGTRWWRLLTIPLMLGLHAGIALCMALGMFPWVMMVVWLPFVPSMAWDWLEKRLPPSWQSVTAPAWLAKLRQSATAPLAAWQQHLATQAVAAGCLVMVFCWCLSSIDPPRFNAAVPGWMKPLILSLRLEQYWGLFAPTPIKNDGWLVLEAELYDHSRVDLLRQGRPLSFAKPANLTSEFPDWKWQKLEDNLTSPGCAMYRQPFGEALARRWSSEQTESGRKVRAWVLHQMLEVTLPHYHAVEPQKRELARNDVFVGPP